jgi:hypothetical protein
MNSNAGCATISPLPKRTLWDAIIVEGRGDVDQREQFAGAVRKGDCSTQLLVRPIRCFAEGTGFCFRNEF